MERSGRRAEHSLLHWAQSVHVEFTYENIQWRNSAFTDSRLIGVAIGDKQRQYFGFFDKDASRIFTVICPATVAMNGISFCDAQIS